MGSRSRIRPASRGFTLIELTVSLVAGLIVALGIVGLSRESTRTFHEEVRSASAEATLRTAIDRLRADLGRAAFMSTGNIMGDPLIVKTLAAPNNITNIPGTMKGLRNLAGIQLFDGGSSANMALSASQVPALTPDAIEIGGNLTSSEQFEVQSITLSGNCARLILSSTSPAMYRVNAVGPASAPVELNNLFQPVPQGLTTQFMVRLVDPTGRPQYLATCPVWPTAGFVGTQPYVDVDNASTPILTAQATGTLGGVPGVPGMCLHCWVNPVQIVRWEIFNSTQEPKQYVNGLDNLSTAWGTADPDKYDLVRSYLDATEAVVPQTTEIIADYAVDLNFAVSVDTSLNVNGTQPSISTLTFDNPANAGTWAYPVSSKPAQLGPQRIRSVRARLATRTAMADRTVNVPLTNYGTQKFLYRYCILPPCATNDGTARWARARTVTTEVSLPNQSRFFY